MFFAKTECVAILHRSDVFYEKVFYYGVYTKVHFSRQLCRLNLPQSHHGKTFA